MRVLWIYVILSLSLWGCAVAPKSEPKDIRSPRYDLGFHSVSWLEFNAIQIGSVKAGQTATFEIAPHDPSTVTGFVAWIGQRKATLGKAKAALIGRRSGRNWYRVTLPVPKNSDGRVYFDLTVSGNRYPCSFSYKNDPKTK